MAHYSVLKPVPIEGRVYGPGQIVQFDEGPHYTELLAPLTQASPSIELLHGYEGSCAIHSPLVTADDQGYVEPYVEPAPEPSFEPSEG
jgi:hypothetical protein